MKKNASVFIVILSIVVGRFAGAQGNTEAQGEAQTARSEQSAPSPSEPQIVEDLDTSPPLDAAQRKELVARIEAALQRFSFEPSLEELKGAALKYSDADPETSRRWRTAPNRAAMLPTLKLVVDHDMERDESLDRYQDEPDRWGADTDCDLGFQVSAQWELDELVFNSDEVRVWGALADRAARREAVLTMLVGYYFERRKLQVKEILSPPDNIEELAELKLRIAELTASIDALTGGYLSSALRKSATGKQRDKK